MTGQQNMLKVKADDAIAKAQRALAKAKKAKARYLNSKRVNIKTLRVINAVQREIKSGKPAWSGRVSDPKTGIVYQVSAVAIPVKES